MTGPRIGLTDLERAKYYPESTIEESTVRVRPDQPIEVSTVGNVINIENLESVDLVDVVTEIATPLTHQDYSVVPHETYSHYLRYLLNGSSSDQNVDGSVTPVDFATTAATRSLIASFDIVIVARNLGSVLDYGIISGGLTNGLQIIKKVGVTETVFFNIRRLVEFAHPSTSGSYQAISLKSNATEDLIIVSIILKDPVIMQTGDQLIMRVRDNLTEVTSGIAYQRATVLLKEV